MFWFSDSTSVTAGWDPHRWLANARTCHANLTLEFKTFNPHRVTGLEWVRFGLELCTCPGWNVAHSWIITSNVSILKYIYCTYFYSIFSCLLYICLWMSFAVGLHIFSVSSYYVYVILKSVDDVQLWIRDRCPYPSVFCCWYSQSCFVGCIINQAFAAWWQDVKA